MINSTPDIDKLSDYILKDQSNLTNFDIKNFQNQIFNTYYGKTIMIVGASGFIATQTIFERGMTGANKRTFVSSTFAAVR